GCDARSIPPTGATPLRSSPPPVRRPCERRSLAIWRSSSAWCSGRSPLPRRAPSVRRASGSIPRSRPLDAGSSRADGPPAGSSRADGPPAGSSRAVGPPRDCASESGPSRAGAGPFTRPHYGSRGSGAQECGSTTKPAGWSPSGPPLARRRLPHSGVEHVQRVELLEMLHHRFGRRVDAPVVVLGGHGGSPVLEQRRHLLLQRDGVHSLLRHVVLVQHMAE